ncbi:MAG TPA: EscN/YscN/HrcN family type III secretion system ATPase [Verrucomicrobia bacterium]|nr:EscN/YscN/HrcN family type III secretion system ATPase [Verrucomicrobiota bacterium]
MNTDVQIDLMPRLEQLPHRSWTRSEGRVTRVIGLTVESTGPTASVGDLAWIETGPVEMRTRIPAEVVGFHERSVILMPIEYVAGIRPGDRVLPDGAMRIAAGPGLLGRVVDGLGRPLDGMPAPLDMTSVEIDRLPPSPLQRTRISSIFHTGVRAIDACMTCAKGQRIGIFAGSGVGKSVLLGSLARHSCATVNVIALVGERGREVRDFIEKNLGDGLQKSVVVAVTSDQSPLLRRKGAATAMAIAEYFRDQGDDVLLMMDSVTRYAMAQREIGLAVGEPPATRGYPPSVFGLLARLLERPGTSPQGTITAFFTVLVEGDDMNDPIADSVRSILDGHIVLSREIAEANHYPAIDVLKSVSRLMSDVAPAKQAELAGRLRELLSVYRRAEDLVNVGAYVAGSNPKIDEALSKINAINTFLKQRPNEIADPAAMLKGLEEALA